MATKVDLEFEQQVVKMCYEMKLLEFKDDFRHIVFHKYLTDEQKIMSLKMLLGESNGKRGRILCFKQRGVTTSWV